MDKPVTIKEHSEYGTRDPDGRVKVWPDYEQAKAHAEATFDVRLVVREPFEIEWRSDRE